MSELLNLEMKGDIFLCLKKFRRIADVLKKQEPDPAKLLEVILDGKFVIGTECLNVVNGHTFSRTAP